MKFIPSHSIDMVMTSPPYDNLRTYGNSLQWNRAIWERIIEHLFRILKDGGVCVWVVGDATVKGNETGTSFRQALYAKKIGFNLHDTMIYQKPQACFGSNLCYLQSFEYMFVFSKGRPKSLNLIRDRNNIRVGKESMSKGGIGKDGSKKQRVRKEMKKYGRRKNIWTYGVGGGNSGHPAVFPLQLAIDHIESWSDDQDIILDPFIGSGTTAIACINTDRNYIGIEKNKRYYKMACEQIKNHKKESEVSH